MDICATAKPNITVPAPALVTVVANIKKMPSTAEKFGGTCCFSAADGVFSCAVIMDE